MLFPFPLSPCCFRRVDPFPKNRKFTLPCVLHDIRELVHSPVGHSCWPIGAGSRGAFKQPLLPGLSCLGSRGLKFADHRVKRQRVEGPKGLVLQSPRVLRGWVQLLSLKWQVTLCRQLHRSGARPLCQDLPRLLLDTSPTAGQAPRLQDTTLGPKVGSTYILRFPGLPKGTPGDRARPLLTFVGGSEQWLTKR